MNTNLPAPSGTSRFEFLQQGAVRLAALALGVFGGVSLFGARRKNTVWQIDPLKCVQCERCATASSPRACLRRRRAPGSRLAFVNYVAEKIEPEFPHVAVDTLAYQYTRKPPKTLKPRPNVIVRLCSIECNFREPLDHPSNAAFADDIRGWSKLCQRLYIWDYTTDFAHYVQPHPNWYTLEANLRFFHANGVRGVFEQGAYQSHGSEMAELRAWVLAQLLWNPQQDGRALIHEFLEGYYGPEAAPHLRRYLDLMHDASKGHNLTCYSPTGAPHLQFKPLAEAEKLWQQSEAAAANSPDFLERIRLGHLAVRYVWLSRWTPLRKEADALGDAWPLPIRANRSPKNGWQWRTDQRANLGPMLPY